MQDKREKMVSRHKYLSTLWRNATKSFFFPNLSTKTFLPTLIQHAMDWIWIVRWISQRFKQGIKVKFGVSFLYFLPKVFGQEGRRTKGILSNFSRERPRLVLVKVSLDGDKWRAWVYTYPVVFPLSLITNPYWFPLIHS